MEKANKGRGLAPTRDDIMHQYAVVKEINLDDAALLASLGRGNMKNEGHRSFFKRYVRKYQLKRSTLQGRPKLDMDAVAAQASSLTCGPIVIAASMPPFSL